MMNENQKKYKEQSKKIGLVLLGISVIVFMALAQLIVKNWLNTIILTIILVGIMILNGVLVALPMKIFIKKYNHEIESIKGGDFTPLLEVQKYKSNKLFAKLTTAISEILGEFKELIENNFKMIKAITSSTEQIEEATSQSVRTMEGISANLQDIAEGATEQAAKSQACEALIEVLSTEIETAYSNCKSMMEATRKITTLSDEGSKSVSSLRNKTKETSESTKEISKAVAMLTEKIKDIATFVDSIENIATQTNLLALNAAIEAARAGDAGRGFGVVAEEIRKLADESRSATEEIKNLVQGVYEEADGATKVMQTMNKATGEEELAVNQTGKAFEHITEGIRFIIDKIDHTDHAISKVNRDKDEVIATVQEIAAVTQTTAAHTEEIASTAETQTSTMENLKVSIDVLNEQVEGLNKKILKYNI